MKRWFPEGNKYPGRVLRDSRFRLNLTAALGGIWNLAYAVFNLCAAGYYHAWWFLTMGVYYLMVFAMRLTGVSASVREGNAAKSLRRNGVFMLILAVTFSGVVLLSIREKRGQTYGTILAVTMAAYTFYCVTMAVINLIRTRKSENVGAIMLRNTAMAYAAGSLFSLEKMMMASFGDGAENFARTMETFSGGGFFLVIFLLGLNLLLLSRQKRNSQIPESEI